MAIPYQAYYCEENTWQRLHAWRESGPTPVAPPLAVLTSNPGRAVPTLFQRAGRGESHLVAWDYHSVVLAHQDGWQIWDPDSLLPMPISATRYLEVSFAFEALPDELAPLFRVIPAETYLEDFCSDRSHMRDSQGAFVWEPPPWPTISPADRGSNLMDWIDMEKAGPGDVLTLAEMKERFS